jgi:hypothetical protein
MTYLQKRIVHGWCRFKFGALEFVGNSLGGGLTRFVNRFWPKFFPRYFSESGCIFIHVPKTAGTAIAMALYGRPVTHHPARFFRHIDPREFARLYKFAILRDPVERFVSAYRFSLSDGTEEVMDDPRVHQVVSRYCDINEFAEEFAKGRLPGWVYEDPIFRNQCYYLTDERGQLLVDDVVLFEEIEKIGLLLKEKGLGLNQGLRKRNITGGPESKRNTCLRVERNAELKAYYSLDGRH